MAIVYRPVSSNTGPNQSQRAGLAQSYSSAVDDTDIQTITEFWSREHRNLWQQWASSFEDYNFALNNPYFDYFFSGEDISVTIEGLGIQDPLAITSFAYNIQQQKQPVYGFWSYTYDAVLRGNRIITGAFSVATTGPITFTKLLAEAARRRSNALRSNTIRDMYSLRGLDDDEINIEKYWRRHLDSSLDRGQQHLFSIHPPFNFVIQYGLQETSLVSNNPEVRSDEFRARFASNTVKSQDFNERLVKNPSDQDDYKVILENVELMSKQVQYDSNGDPIVEIYSFMARDERMISDAVYTQSNPISSDIDMFEDGNVTYND
jgi:hypothetical protein